MYADWLLTWTTYGTWLPGDERGFVTDLPNARGHELRKNKLGTAYPAKMRGLSRYARSIMHGSPLQLSLAQAELLLPQFQETCVYRGYLLRAVAIMTNHIHLVCTAPAEVDGEKLLADFKSYGSRKLNAVRRPVNGTWWTASGSRRKLRSLTARLRAIRYTCRQEYPLLIWTTDVPELELKAGIQYRRQSKPEA